MAEQNPWKKQMQQNRNQNNTDSTAPISQFPPQQKITPPWIKNKEPESTTTPVNTQLPWIKGNPSNTNNESGSAPTWMKAKQNTSNDTGSTAPWMKGKQGANSTQVQFNKTAQKSTVSGPAWMQKKAAQQQSTTSNVSGWKAGGTAFGGDKKKKQEEERLRKEQEEKERLETEREEKKRLEKEKEQEEEAKARERMEKQDNLSKQRQQSDRQKEMERRRGEQEKKGMQQQQRVRRQKQPKSSLKQQLQSRAPPDRQAPFYIQYLYYFTQSTNQQLQYRQKVLNQINLFKVCHQFTHLIQNKAIQIVTQNQLNPSKPILSSTKKNKIIDLSDIRTQVYYAFCEGQQLQPQSPQLTPKQPKQPTIKFDMSQMQKLQKVFNFYNTLTNIICSLQKRQPNIITKFRTPLFSYIQYKGIAFLSQCYTQQLLQTQTLLPFQLKEIISDFSLIQKQLKEKHHYHLGKTDLAIKKLFIQDIQEQVYIIYLKNWDLKLSKHAQTPNQPSIQQLTTDYYFLTQSIGRKTPLIPQSQFQVFKKVKTQAFSQLGDVLHLAQCIFVVYSSCQGQVQEKEFWELILSQSEDIWKLIRSAGYKGKLHKDKRFLFTLFQLYSGVQIKLDTKKSSKQQKLTVKKNKSIKAVYEFVRLDSSQVIRNFDKYLKDSRYELAEHSLKLFQDLQAIAEPINLYSQFTPQDNISQTNSFNYILQYSKLLISKQQFRQATKVLEEFVKKSQILLKNSFANIPIKMELLVLYIKLKNQPKILQTFSHLLQVVEFYFGANSLINATLYQMLASYYSLKPKQPENSVQGHVITLYEHALSIVLRFYGDQSEAIAEVYLSRAVAFLNLLNFDLFHKDIDHALKIFKSQSRKKYKIAECLFHKGRAKLLPNNTQPKSQGFQLIEQSSSIYLRISHFPQAIEGFLIVIQMLDEKADEDMKKIELISNQVIQTLIQSFKSFKHLSKAVNIIMTKLDSQLKGLISDMAQKYKNIQVDQFSIKSDVRKTQQNQKKLYNDFEQTIKGFSSFVEMIKWVGYTAMSIVKTQICNSTSKQKFFSIAQLLSSLMTLEPSQKTKDNLESENQQLNSANSQSQVWDKSESSKFNKSTISQKGQYSPIGQMKNYEQ